MLLLHAALLGRLPQAAAPGRLHDTATVLQVRQLRISVAPVPAVPAAVAGPSTALAAAPAPTLAPALERVRPAALAALPLPPASTAAAPPPAGGPPLPRYATRLPPPATLQYTLLREGPGAPGRPGLQAELRWRPEAGRYTLTLGFGAAGWASVGGLDAHGVAPERHVETRRGRELRAANFRREAGPTGGRISYSGPPVEHPLLPGAQDRLSWMLQLPAVLEADPALGQPGSEVQLFVAGVRGDAAVWAFVVAGRGAIDLPAGTVAEAVHLQREPPRPYDTRVDVWLDPAHHHLPVRVRLQHRGGEGEGASTDFVLTQLSLP